MSGVCVVTGRRPQSGMAVSHSHRRTKRWYKPNIQRKRYWVPSLRRTVTLTVSTRGMKIIDARGIDAVVADLQRRGVRF